MSSVTLPHGLNVEPASLTQRFLAALVDAALVLLLLCVPFINFALAPLYGFGRDCWPKLRGQSIGKKLVGIRVISLMTGHDIENDFRSGVSRNFLNLFLGLDLLSIFFTKHRQRLGDKIALTLVVKNTVALQQFLASVHRNNKRYVHLSDFYEAHKVC